MSTQLKQLPDDPDWKDRYYRALNEFDEKDKKRSEEEGALYKSILRLIFSYTGVDKNLDQQLTNMRDKLRQETGNQARNKIINPVIDSVVHLAQQRGTQQKSDSVNHLIYLLDTLVLPDSYHRQLKTIGLTLGNIDEDKDIDSCIDQLVHVIEEAAKGENT